MGTKALGSVVLVPPARKSFFVFFGLGFRDSFSFFVCFVFFFLGGGGGPSSPYLWFRVWGLGF